MTAKAIPLVVVAAFLLAQIVWASLSYAGGHAGGPGYPTISTSVTGVMTTSPKTVSYNAGTGSNRVLLVSVGTDDRVNKINSITYGGQALTQAYSTGQLAPSSVTARIQLFYLLNPASGTNNLTFTASASDNYAYAISYVSGADITSVGTVNNNSGTGTSLSVSNTPSASNSLIVTAFGSNNTSTNITASGGSVEAGDSPGSSIRAALYSKVGGSAGSPITTNATAGNDGWGAIALEIKQAVVLPEVSVNAYDDEAQEPGAETPADSTTFVFERTGDDSDELEVDFDLDGTANLNLDYQFDTESSDCNNFSSNSLTIPEGSAACEIVILPEYDEEFNEDTETVNIELNSSSGYTLGAADSDTAYIFNTEDESGGEGGGACVEYWCPYVDYTIDSPGYASMYVYDDDTVPSGQVNTFVATPSRVQSGDVATLSWNITGMTSCSIDNGVGTVDGTDGLHTATTPAVTQRTTFTLSCSDGVSTVISRVSVGIVPSFIEQ